MPGLQDTIHHWSEGKGARYVKFLLLLVAAVTLAVIYDLRAYRGFSSIEAMDNAQLARNIASGKGYVTDCIRPFSLYLLQKHANDRMTIEMKGLSAQPPSQWTPEQKAAADKLIAPGMLTSPHPDITNPPGYPYLLAGFMRLVPFDYQINFSQPFERFQPELLIAIMNQTLLFLAVWMLYCLSRRLFDNQVALFSALALLGSDIFWRFSVSGISTLLLVVLFLAVVWMLVWLEHGAEMFWGPSRLVLVAIALGGLLGLAALTRYSFAWLLIPVVIFMVAFLGRYKALLLALVLLVFAAVVTPWLMRNYELSGTLMGTANYTLHEGTYSFPDTRLPRSLSPDFHRVDASDIPEKLTANIRGVLLNDLPLLGGSWITAFFLAGLLIPFRSLSLSRLRYFMLLCLGVFVAVQSLGRTHLSGESPDINTDNQLVVFAPLIFIFGVAMFLTLVDQSRAAIWEVRPLFLSALGLLVCLPMVLRLLPPRVFPVAFPPYNAPIIQTISGWMKPDELMMSDMPWAVAWYGQRSCIWLPLNSESDFMDIHKQRNVSALYLTPRTLDNRFLTQWVKGENQGWGGFVAEILLRREVPTGFPLKKAYADWFPEHLFLSDYVRWQKEGSEKK